MKLLTSQEKTVFRLLMGTAIFGLIVGFVRHNYLGKNELTLSTSQGSDSVIDDLTNVKGSGPKTLEKLKDHVTL